MRLEPRVVWIICKEKTGKVEFTDQGGREGGYEGGRAPDLLGVAMFL